MAYSHTNMGRSVREDVIPNDLLPVIEKMSFLAEQKQRLGKLFSVELTRDFTEGRVSIKRFGKNEIISFMPITSKPVISGVWTTQDFIFFVGLWRNYLNTIGWNNPPLSYFGVYAEDYTPAYFYDQATGRFYLNDGSRTPVITYAGMKTQWATNNPRNPVYPEGDYSVGTYNWNTDFIIFNGVGQVLVRKGQTAAYAKINAESYCIPASAETLPAFTMREVLSGPYFHAGTNGTSGDKFYYGMDTTIDGAIDQATQRLVSDGQVWQNGIIIPPIPASSIPVDVPDVPKTYGNWEADVQFVDIAAPSWTGNYYYSRPLTQSIGPHWDFHPMYPPGTTGTSFPAYGTSGTSGTAAYEADEPITTYGILYKAVPHNDIDFLPYVAGTSGTSLYLGAPLIQQKQIKAML